VPVRALLGLKVVVVPEHDEKLLLAQVVFDQSSGAGRQVTHPQLAHPVADERTDGSGVLGFEQADRHPRESAPEGADQRGQGIDREGGEAGQLQASPGEPAHLGDRPGETAACPGPVPAS